MNVQINELSDGRFIGFGIFECCSFPLLVSETEIEQTWHFFLNTIQDFFKTGRDGNTAAELLWITDKTEGQNDLPSAGKIIRIFCIVRKIETGNSTLQTDIECLLNHFAAAFSAKQFLIDTGDTVFPEFVRLITSINNECLFAVAKSEKCAGNAASVYPYYYTDLVPANNTDNFVSITAVMKQYENCCICFQLFPAQLTMQEKVYLNDVSAELGRLCSGIPVQSGVYKDKAAEEPFKVLSAINERVNSPLFLYNILVFGKKTDCISLSGKIISLLQSGKKRIMKADFICHDLSGEKVNLPAQYLYYPWNINNKLLYAYRNRQFFNQVPMVKVLYRLPYIMNADEAASFFRLPFRENPVSAEKETENSFVFISHSSKDSETAKTVCQFLEENAIPCWIAPRDIKAGGSYAAQILKAIRGCKIFLLLASENTNNSEHVNNEIERSFEYKKTMIPFMLQDIQFPDEQLYFLSRKQQIDAYSNFETGLESLLSAITHNGGA